MTRMVVTTNYCMRNEVLTLKFIETKTDEHGFEFPILYLCSETDWLLIYVYPLLWFISKWTYYVTDVRCTKMAAQEG